MNIQKLTYNPNTKNIYKMRSSRSPKKMFKFFEIYSRGRKESAIYLKTLMYSTDTVLNGCGLRIMEDETGNILAGYTYRMRKNKLDEKSMYIDGLARNLSKDKKQTTCNIMTQVYEDIKKTAQKKKAKEVTLFVHAGENGLKKNYQNLGFKEDVKCNIHKVYLMRVRVKDFLDNIYFKCRKYKETAGLNSILSKFPLCEK